MSYEEEKARAIEALTNSIKLIERLELTRIPTPPPPVTKDALNDAITTYGTAIEEWVHADVRYSIRPLTNDPKELHQTAEAKYVARENIDALLKQLFGE